MERFPSLQEALARYRALPSRQAKSLGMTDGIHVLELARHVLIYPAETAWEDVQAARPELLPLWAEIPEATAAAEDCISALNLRYQLSGSVVTPVPSRDRLRRDLRDKYLWLSGESGQETALRWVYYASGRGLDIPWCFAVRQMDSRNRALISYWRHCPGNTTY